MAKRHPGMQTFTGAEHCEIGKSIHLKNDQLRRSTLPNGVEIEKSSALPGVEIEKTSHLKKDMDIKERYLEYDIARFNGGEHYPWGFNGGEHYDIGKSASEKILVEKTSHQTIDEHQVIETLNWGFNGGEHYEIGVSVSENIFALPGVEIEKISHLTIDEHLEIGTPFNGGEHYKTGKLASEKILALPEVEIMDMVGAPFNGGEHCEIGVSASKNIFALPGVEIMGMIGAPFNGGKHYGIGKPASEKILALPGVEIEKISHLTIKEHLEIGTPFNGGEHCKAGKLASEKILALPGVEIEEISYLKKDEHRRLTLPNGVEIKFEEILALAGDFYGLPKQPIISPFMGKEQDSGRHQRFKDAYDTLARAPKDELQKELDKLLATLEKEIEDGTCVDAKTWDKITGGKWFSALPVKQGRMLQLAENNHDHFLPYAEDAYVTGHELAMAKAREASYRSRDSKSKKELLHEAFSMEAFACHFLTDSFASGHIRTPRVELGKGTTFGKNGHLLCKYMHDEDNDYGLRVTNRRGDKWIAYGDGMLLKDESKDNFRIVIEAVQKSVDQVYKAYTHPNTHLHPAEVTDLIPFVDQEEKNNFPLFQVKPDGKLHRRSDIDDLQDTKTITDWWGPTTAAMLQVYKPGNSAI